MIVLDTNVLSELMQANPEPRVVQWLDAQPPESVWTTAITVFEVRYGLAILPEGRRRRILQAAFETALAQDLGDRVLDFDLQCAGTASEVAAELREAGHPVDIRDVMIAGIARAYRATLATRNTRHFSHTGVSLADPWSAA